MLKRVALLALACAAALSNASASANGVSRLQVISPTIRKPVISWPAYSTGNTTMTSTAAAVGTARLWQYAPRAVQGLQLKFSNYIYTSGGDGTTGGGPLTVKATIEYPQNVFTPVTCNGSTTCTIPLGAVNFLTDVSSVSIPAGSLYAVRDYVAVSGSGIVIPAGAIVQSNANGNWIGASNYSGGSDATSTSGTGWANSGGPGSAYGPDAVLGDYAGGNNNVAVPCIGAGDSIDFGQGNNAPAATGAWGAAFQAANIPYLFFPQPGDALSLFLAGNNAFARWPQIEGCTAIVNGLGTNDLYAQSQTYAQLKANYLTLIAQEQARGLDVFVRTLLPRLSSATCPVSGQTFANATSEGYRQSFNAWERAPASSGVGNSEAADLIAAGLKPVILIDAAAAVEVNSSNAFSLTGGYDYCGSGNNTAYTVDGVHPTAAGYTLMQAALNATKFTAPAIPGGAPRISYR